MILLDLMMPEISGFAVVEALQRRHGDRPHTDHHRDRQVHHRGTTARNSATRRDMVVEIVEKSSFNRAELSSPGCDAPSANPWGGCKWHGSSSSRTTRPT